MTKRKIIKDFTLFEISGVDRPAQPTARMAIMKNYDASAEAVESVEVAAPVETVEVATPVESVEVAEPVEAVEVAEPVEAVEVAEPVEAAEPIETVEVAEPIETVEVAEPIETVEVAEPIETVEVAEPVETVEVAEPIETVEVAEPIETVEVAEPVEAPQTVDVAEPVEAVEVAEPVEAAESIEKGASDIEDDASDADTSDENGAESDVTPILAPLEDRREEIMEEIESLRSELNFLNLLIGYDSPYIEVYKSLSEKEKKELKEMSGEELEAALKDKKDKEEKDEKVEIEGKTVKKSLVGEEAFNLYKRQSELEKQLKEVEIEKNFAILEKRASDEFGHLAARPSDIANVIKCIEELPNDVKSFLFGLMKSANDLGDKATREIGSPIAASIEKSAGNFEAKVSEIMKRDNVKKSRAYEIAVREFPELIPGRS